MVTIGVACLKCQRPQAESNIEARALFWLCQGIQDAPVGKGLAHASGGHVDAEKAIFPRPLANAGCQIVGLVLPGEAVDQCATGKALVAGNAGNLPVQPRQLPEQTGGVGFHPQQVFIQPLLELAVCIGVGIEWVVAVAITWLGGQTGVVVVCQHQAKSGQVQGVRVVQPVVREQPFVFQHPACKAGGAFTPGLAVKRRALGELPALFFQLLVVPVFFVLPFGAFATRPRLQVGWQAFEIFFSRSPAVSIGGQPVMTQDKPAHRLRQGRKLFHGWWRGFVDAVAEDVFR